MLVKINKDLFVLATDVVSVKRIKKTSSENYGEWVAVVKREHGVTQYLIPESEVRILVSDINNALKN